MAIKEILEFGKDVAGNLDEKAREFDFKSYEHDCFMSESARIERIILDIESCLHVPGVFKKLDYREDIKYYWDLLEQNAETDARCETLKHIEKAVKNTLLWAKKLSWLGDWDLNYDGRHTIMSVSFVPEAGIAEYEVPRHYFHTGEKITNRNYKLEIRSTESDFREPLRIDFTDDWDGIEFNLQRNNSCMTLRGTAFTWDKAKFAGFISERPFYAERETEFFGNKHIVYYSAK